MHAKPAGEVLAPSARRKPPDMAYHVRKINNAGHRSGFMDDITYGLRGISHASPSAQRDCPSACNDMAGPAAGSRRTTPSEGCKVRAPRRLLLRFFFG